MNTPRLLTAKLGVAVLIALMTMVASVTAEAVTFAPNLCKGTDLTACPSPTSGGGTWITADFQTLVLGTSVTVTMNAALGTQFISDWWFNLDPAITGALSLSNYSFISGNGFTGATGTGPGINVPINQQVDGGGLFDVDITFNVSAGNRFDDADSFTFRINCTAGTGQSCAGFSATSFDLTNAPSGTNDNYITSPTGVLVPIGTPLRTIAHVQGCCGTLGSNFIAGAVPTSAPVPEPTMLVLLGSGLVGLGAAARRFRRK